MREAKRNAPFSYRKYIGNMPKWLGLVLVSLMLVGLVEGVGCGRLKLAGKVGALRCASRTLLVMH